MKLENGSLTVARSSISRLSLHCYFSLSDLLPSWHQIRAYRTAYPFFTIHAIATGGLGNRTFWHTLKYRPTINFYIFWLTLRTEFVYTANMWKMTDLSYFKCYDCENFFFTLELPLGINDPNFCAYCGTEFLKQEEVDEHDL